MSGATVPVVVVHGGAGDVPPERRERHIEGCRTAAAQGLAVLVGGGSALDACVRAVMLLEDDPWYNAGTGGSLTDAGELELDAAVMEGTQRTAGAVGALPPFRNPIAIARAVLHEGRHVLYVGEGAAALARRAGFEPADPEAMITERARRRLARRLEGRAGEGWAGGTVGAVACDAQGRVAAATSTGGTVGKAPGRVGDSPIIGAGTFADDAAGACSATGIGETIMRACLARVAVDQCRSSTAEEAAASAMKEFARFEGSGGLILVDSRGGTAHVWNTEIMSHAVAREGESIRSGN